MREGAKLGHDAEHIYLENGTIGELKNLINNLPDEARIMWHSWRYNKDYEYEDYNIFVQDGNLLIADTLANEDAL